MNVELNPWNNLKVIHKSKIKQFDYLVSKRLIHHIDSGYYYAVDNIENLYFKSRCEEMGIDQKIEKKVDCFIKQLNKYNELKDCAESLIGKIAELKGVSIKEMREEIGVPE